MPADNPDAWIFIFPTGEEVMLPEEPPSPALILARSMADLMITQGLSAQDAHDALKLGGIVLPDE